MPMRQDKIKRTAFIIRYIKLNSSRDEISLVFQPVYLIALLYEEYL